MNNDIGSIFTQTLSNVNLWAAIVSCIAIIALGYILVKVKVFKQEWKSVLNNLVLKVALPALAIKGFMSNITIKQLTEQGVILGISFGFYIILLIIAELWIRFFPKLLPAKFRVKSQSNFSEQNNSISGKIADSITNSKSQDDLTKRSLVIWMMLIFGSTTFFGMPIINVLYPGDGVMAAGIWNIGYRVFLYSYCFMVMAGLKFNKENIASSMKSAFLNPIVIATFLGLILWLTQLIPGASSFGVNFTSGTNGWFNLGKTMPYISKPFETLSNLASPLVWLSIGMTLASSSILSATKDKWVWIFSIEKLILIPLLIFAIMIPLVDQNIVSKAVAISMVIFAATPPATVVLAYSMQYKVCENFASQCSALSTLLAIILIPVWVVICEATFQSLV